MSDATSFPTMFRLTPLDPVYRHDPDAVLGEIRSRAPVLPDPDYGATILTGYDQVRPLLSDLTLWRDGLNADEGELLKRLSPEALAALRESRRSESMSILELDDPDHARIRQPLAQAFYARVARIRPAVERIADAALAAIDASAPFDLMVSYCVPIPIDVIAAILGVDESRLAEFRAWSEGVIQMLNPFRSPAQQAQFERCREAIDDYFAGLLAARRTAPRDDLVSDMARLQADGLSVSDVELRINLAALLVGGNLTTTDLIGNTARLLMLHPAELAKLQGDPRLIGAVVEEALRYEPPVEVTGRVASRDLELAGCPVRRAQSLTLLLRAANHDPAAFDNPDRFDVTARRKPHVAFGGGAHICIGAPLARLEAQVALARLFERFPKLRLTEPEAPPAWRPLPFFRGLERLEVAA